MTGEPLLRVKNLEKHFPVTRGVLQREVGTVRAVDGISFDIAPGETLGLVGESGCGKTTAGRAILRLIEPSGGQVLFEGKDLSTLHGAELRRLRRDMQIIFQDPFSSLNPRMRIRDIVGEALAVHQRLKGEQLIERVGDLLEKVGVSRAFVNRYPHEFSGGQRQRIGIARAIALHPKLIVCDEAVSALDVSIRAQVLNLLIDLREELSLSYLFISHDLSVVKHISSRIAVMYLGQIVELGVADELFARPAHPYTRALLSAIPLPNPRKKRERTVLEGDVPTPLNPPSGCRFHTRCPARFDRCEAEEPELHALGNGHVSKCHHAEGLERASNWSEQLDDRIGEAERRQIAGRASVRPAEVEQLSPLEGERVSEPPPSESRAGPARGGRALVLLGLAVVLAGHWLSGFALAMGAHLAWWRPRLVRPLAADAVVVVLLAAMVSLSSASSEQAKLAQTRRELSALAEQVQEFRGLDGDYPAQLSLLGWRLFEVFESGEAVDPWGRAYRYRAPGKAAGGGELKSLGPDLDSASDDVVVGL